VTSENHSALLCTGNAHTHREDDEWQHKDANAHVELLPGAHTCGNPRPTLSDHENLRLNPSSDEGREGARGSNSFVLVQTFGHEDREAREACSWLHSVPGR
jgi:hypothetical protein